jgi:GAF domain-containing protein
VLYADSFEKPYGFRKEDLSLLTELTNLAAIAIDDALFYKDFKKTPD